MARLFEAARSPRVSDPHHPKKRSNRRGARILLLTFCGVLALFAYYNTQAIKGSSSGSGVPAVTTAGGAQAKARLELETGETAASTLHSEEQEQEGKQATEPGAAGGGAAAARPKEGVAGADGDADLDEEQQQPTQHQPAVTADEEDEDGGSIAGVGAGTAATTAGAGAATATPDTKPPAAKQQQPPAKQPGGKRPAGKSGGGGTAGAGAAIAAAATKDGKAGGTGGAAGAKPEPPTVIEGNPHAWDRASCAAGIDQHPASGKMAQLTRPPTRWRRRADPAADEEAKRVVERPGEVQAPGQLAMPAAAKPTVVLYVHFGADEDEEANLRHFVAAGTQEDDNVQYRVVLTTPAPLDKAALPRLPPNGRYLQAPAPACNASVWGAIGSVMQSLDLQPWSYLVVATSRAMGPFVPPYVRQYMHWTEAFTSKLSDSVKLVGSQISCEGAPAAGDARGPWRRNPRVLPWAWATDSAGWDALTAGEVGAAVFACHASPWDVRYLSDAGASLAILNKGWNLASLQARYQGVDWRQPAAWACNARLAPDFLLAQDGAHPSPYELVFLPYPEPVAERHAELRAGLKYRDWSTEGTLLPDNMYMGPGVWFWEWSPRVERSLELNALHGGPKCFDYEAYKKAYPELRGLASSCLGPKCGFDLFQHYVALGQFQGRTAKFTCPLATASRSQLVQLALGRGRACFNATAYLAASPDLAHLATPQQAFVHWALSGRSEGRRVDWVCADSSYGLAFGTDGTPTAELERERLQLLADYEQHGDKLLDYLVKEQGRGQQQAGGVATAAAGAAADTAGGSGVGAVAAAAAATDEVAAAAAVAAQQQQPAATAAGDDSVAAVAVEETAASTEQGAAGGADAVAAAAVAEDDDEAEEAAGGAVAAAGVQEQAS